MAVSETKGQGWRAIPTQRYINLNPVRLFVQRPPKKGSRGSFKLLC